MMGTTVKLLDGSQQTEIQARPLHLTQPNKGLISWLVPVRQRLANGGLRNDAVGGMCPGPHASARKRCFCRQHVLRSDARTSVTPSPKPRAASRQARAAAHLGACGVMDRRQGAGKCQPRVSIFRNYRQRNPRIAGRLRVASLRFGA